MRDIARHVRQHFVSAFGLSGAAVERLVQTSRAALAETLGALRKSLEDSDAQGASHWAHSMKGNLLNAGLGDLAAEAGRIEHEAMRGETGGTRDRLKSLEEGLKPFLNGH